MKLVFYHMLVIVPEEHKDVYWIYCGGLSVFTLIGNSIWFFLVREICLMPAPLILMAIGSYKWNGGL